MENRRSKERHFVWHRICIYISEYRKGPAMQLRPSFVCHKAGANYAFRKYISHAAAKAAAAKLEADGYTILWYY